MQWRVIDPTIANIKYGFANNPTFNNELSYKNINEYNYFR